MTIANLPPFYNHDWNRSEWVIESRHLAAIDMPVPPGYLIYGPHGSGKTTFAVSIARGADRAGRSVAFTGGWRLRQRLGDYRDPGGVARELLEAMERVDVLVIDDIDLAVRAGGREVIAGVSHPMSHIAEWLSTVIHHRYHYRMITVVTTSKTKPIALYRIGDDIADRLDSLRHIPLGRREGPWPSA